ncbi:MAG: hypothetical protein HN571_03690, partial [Bacteroidetes bacterium]|nr:hypothetical protein [Bacteroidota bacterium]
INKRTSFSALDFALLKDIGYNISGDPVGTNIGGTFTDPTLGGTYYIPVKETYASWLAGGGGGGVGGGGSAARPEMLEERIRADVYYIEHWSFLLDLRIVIETAVRTLFAPATLHSK